MHFTLGKTKAMQYQAEVLQGGLLSLGCRVPKAVRKFKVGARQFVAVNGHTGLIQGTANLRI